jgi:hypothetical protein
MDRAATMGASCTEGAGRRVHRLLFTTLCGYIPLTVVTKENVMKLHFHSRPAALAALAISLIVLAGFPQLAGAASANGAGKGRESAPGYAKKLPPPDQAQAEATPSAGTPTAADHPEGSSTHDATNGPGGQVCDGDPSNAPGAGGNYENTCPAGPSQNGAGDGNATGKPCAGCVGNADDKNPKGQASSGPSDHNNGYECDQKGRSANEGNNGVGFGNPAHTGCTSSVTPPPTCPDGSAMPASGNVKDCTPKPPKCPDGSAMPASGNVKDCGPKPPTCADGSVLPEVGTGTCPQTPPTCPAGSVMPAGGDEVGDCLPTCPNGSVMPASGDVADCTTGGGTVLGETLGRPTQVLGVELERSPSSGVLAFTGGAHLGGLLQLAGLLGLVGGGLTTVGRRRRDDECIDIRGRLAGHC